MLNWFFKRRGKKVSANESFGQLPTVMNNSLPEEMEKGTRKRALYGKDAHFTEKEMRKKMIPFPKLSRLEQIEEEFAQHSFYLRSICYHKGALLYDLLQKNKHLADLLQEILDLFTKTFPNISFKKGGVPKNSHFFKTTQPKASFSLTEQEEIQNHLESCRTFLQNYLEDIVVLSKEDVFLREDIEIIIKRITVVIG